MKKLTRGVALILALCALLTLAACGKKAKLEILSTDYTVEDYAICVAKDNDALLADINGALQTLIDNGTVKQVIDYYISGTGSLPAYQANVPAGAKVLKMATNAEFPPYEFKEGGKIVGIDAVIAGLIADQLGMKLEISDIDFGAIIAGVQTGKYDMGMAGMTVNEERLQNVNFTVSYATGVQVVVVKEGSKITDLDVLSAGTYKIGVQQDTTGDIYATEDFGEDRVVRYNTCADAIQALLSGKVDCCIMDNEPAKSYVAANNK